MHCSVRHRESERERKREREGQKRRIDRRQNKIIKKEKKVARFDLRDTFAHLLVLRRAAEGGNRFEGGTGWVGGCVGRESATWVWRSSGQTAKAGGAKRPKRCHKIKKSKSSPSPSIPGVNFLDINSAIFFTSAIFWD